MKVLAPFIAVMFLSSFSLADGGYLKYFELPAGATKEEPAWSVYDRFDYTHKAVMKIPDRDMVEMRVFGELGQESNPPLIAASERGPCFLFCDSNGDRQADSNEVFYSDQQRNLISNARFLLSHGDVSREIVADVPIYYGGYVDDLIIDRIKSRYEGTVEIKAEEYPARIIFLSVFPDGRLVNEILMLDANGDGRFHRLEDEWCSAQGPGRLLGKLRTVQTEFTEEGARVKLLPYQGPVGTWTATGEGIHRVFLEKTDGGHRRPLIRVDEDATDGIDLPVGDYKVQVSLLKIGSATSNQYIQHDHRMHRRTLDFNLSAGQSLKSYIGGPVKAQVTANPFTAVFGIVMMNLMGCHQVDGPLEFSPVSFVQGRGYQWEEPKYEIADSSGKVVATGNFEYG